MWLPRILYVTGIHPLFSMARVMYYIYNWKGQKNVAWSSRFMGSSKTLVVLFLSFKKTHRSGYCHQFDPFARFRGFGQHETHLPTQLFLHLELMLLRQTSEVEVVYEADKGRRCYQHAYSSLSLVVHHRRRVRIAFIQGIFLFQSLSFYFCFRFQQDLCRISALRSLAHTTSCGRK